MIIKEVLKLPGVERLRYTSPYPSYYNQELFNLHETEPKLCPHIHIPVQSGSNNILKKMFRGYSVETFKTFIDQIQSLKRDISITTDIIVGFPGETEEDFAETLALVKYAKFDVIYIGIYSPRK
jgi:tRNA-2-methylthio-N6-dimethylallyladenosine synthase